MAEVSPHEERRQLMYLRRRPGCAHFESRLDSQYQEYFAALDKGNLDYANKIMAKSIQPLLREMQAAGCLG
jgi:hypothetical protein